MRTAGRCSTWVRGWPSTWHSATTLALVRPTTRQTARLAKAADIRSRRGAAGLVFANVTRTHCDGAGPWATHIVRPSGTCRTVPSKMVPASGSGAPQVTSGAPLAAVATTWAGARAAASKTGRTANAKRVMEGHSDT